MEEFYKIPLINELFESRQEKFSRHIVKTSKEHNEYVKELENMLNNLLNFVPNNQRKNVEPEIQKILEEIGNYATFWNGYFYKLGLVDGEKLQDEIKEIKEKCVNG